MTESVNGTDATPTINLTELERGRMSTLLIHMHHARQDMNRINDDYARVTDRAMKAESDYREQRRILTQEADLLKTQVDGHAAAFRRAQARYTAELSKVCTDHQVTAAVQQELVPDFDEAAFEVVRLIPRPAAPPK